MKIMLRSIIGMGIGLAMSTPLCAQNYIGHDLNFGTGQSGPTPFVQARDTIYFQGTHATFGEVIFTMDPNGNTNFMPVNPNAYDALFNEAAVAWNDVLYFRAQISGQGVELAYSKNNFSLENTDINTMVGSSNPSELTPGGTRMYFAATSSTGGRELYSIDQSDVVNEISIATGDTSSNPNNLFYAQGLLFFSAEDRNGNQELWVYNGATATQHELVIGDAASNPSDFIQYNGDVYFVAADANGQRNVYQYAIATSGITQVPNSGGIADLQAEELMVADGKLYMTVASGPGRELAVFDGASPISVVNLTDVDVSNANNLHWIDGRIYLQMDVAGERELGVYDPSIDVLLTLDLDENSATAPHSMVSYSNGVLMLGTNASAQNQFYYVNGNQTQHAALPGYGLSNPINPQDLHAIGGRYLFNGTFNALGQDLMEITPCVYAQIESLSTSPLCLGDEITLDVAGQLFESSDWVWRRDSLNGDSLGSGLSLLHELTDTIQVFVRGEGNCGMSPWSDSLTLIPLEKAVFDSAHIISQQCHKDQDGGLVTFISGGNGALEYDWDADGLGDYDDASSLSLIGAGDYQLLVRDAEGCIIDTTLTIDSIGLLRVEPEFEDLQCFEDNSGSIEAIVRGGTQPYQYDWDNDGILDFDDEALIEDLAAGTYAVSIRDAQGCVTSMSQTLIEPVQVEIMGDSMDASCPTCFDGGVDITVFNHRGNYLVDWSDDGLGEFDDVEDITGLIPDVYTVQVVDDSGCIGTAEFTVGFLISSIDELDASLFKVYPNPVSDYVIVDWKGTQAIESIYLMTIEGRVVKQLPVTEDAIELNHLASGKYLLNVVFNDGNWVNQLLIKP